MEGSREEKVIGRKETITNQDEEIGCRQRSGDEIQVEETN